MRELTFCTTNLTKLAHARHVAEGRRISIHGFRQRTYRADYHEPRLPSRDELLKESYANAKSQVEKAGFSLQSHVFFLEDTSVRIEALSDGGSEVPGVDIKYWMENRTFDQLDRALRDGSGLRGATVRSDVVMHVPHAHRKDWGVDELDEYLIFVGEQSGSIVEREYEFASNLVFPWLDNRSFNRWFVPDGMDRPLGALPISSADLVDFRRKSFGRAFDFLEAKGFLAKHERQLDMRFAKMPDLILCGFTCAGKTAASQHLARKFGYLHVEASDFMHLGFYQRHGFKGPISIGDFAEDALAQKPTIAAASVEEYILQNPSQPIVISGFRSPAEIKYIKEKFGRRWQFDTIFIEADQDERFRRAQARARPGESQDADKFRQRDDQQVRMGLSEIRDIAERLPNDDTYEVYISRIERLILNPTINEVQIADSIRVLSAIGDVGLQDAVLIALLSVWTDDETRQFYSTTEIARLVADVLPGLEKKKHKDNISRFFNQDFYAYFEIGTVGRSRTRRYRLSNTGYGMAVRRVSALTSGR